ncbi:MAG: glycosyltransferase family 4 protein [Deltaproteobacteria bacterium]|nr:glycosyltransferase family 4 protein [Deltaproteobacteria bacterium]MDQ3297517.1 glycosyltransferase family 4 protein [Myxococcota bacterium]
MTARRPRVCIVGSLVGRNPGRVTTQGEKLWDLLEAAGYPVIGVSTSMNRYVRLADIASTITRRRAEIDVLVIFTYGLKSFVIEDMASMLGKRFGIPIIMTPCGGTLPWFMGRFPRWTARVLARADAFVCQSSYLDRALRERGHRPHVIPNIIDVAGYRHRQRERVRPRLFWMRTFEDLYNPLLALRTLARVRERHPDATLVLAGQDAPFRTVVEARARELGVADAVRYPGFLDLDGKQRAGDACDIFLNTPRIDNRPICVVEAAALGLPVVSTDVGGMRDLLEQEQTGLLVPDDDDRAMADAVLRLVDDPALASGLSARGRVLAEQSAIELVRPQWERVLADVVKRKPSPAVASPAAFTQKVH